MKEAGKADWKRKTVGWRKKRGLRRKRAHIASVMEEAPIEQPQRPRRERLRSVTDSM